MLRGDLLENKQKTDYVNYEFVNYLVCHKFEVDCEFFSTFRQNYVCRCYVIAVEFSALTDRGLPLRKQT